MACSVRAVQAVAARPAPITARTEYFLADAYRAHARELEREVIAASGIDSRYAKAVVLETWMVALQRLETGVRVLPSGVLPWLIDLSGTVLATLTPLVRSTTGSPSAARPLAA